MLITTMQTATYAESVLKDPSRIDALEVHGVLAVPDNNGDTICEIDDDNPMFFSVYVHLRRGGIDCLADFPTREEAESYARSIAAEYGWRVW